MTIDELYLEIRACANKNNIDRAKKLLGQLRSRVAIEIKGSVAWRPISILIESVKNNKEASILDYGCGGGRTTIYLHLLGYTNVFGIDLISQQKNSLDPELTTQTLNNRLIEILGYSKPFFFEYDGVNMPFDDNTFDIVYSEQVLEHVQNLNAYYRESSRVLRPGAEAYFSFPHKYIPYDSHGNTWFVHMLPESLRMIVYNMLGRDILFLKQLLNYRSVYYHKKLAANYFSRIQNITPTLLTQFSSEDLNRYKGNRFIRGVVDKLVKQPFLGPTFTKCISIFSMANLIMINNKPNHL